MIESIPKIIGRNPEVKFVFVGPIDDPEYFREIYRTLYSRSLTEHCVFTGTVPSCLLPDYFATADVCVVPSITEAGPPLTLLQAMSSARAIVASSIAQNVEAAKQGDEIVFVDPLNEEQLSVAINKLFADEKCRKRLGEKAREIAIKNFDWKSTAKATMCLYEGILSR